MSTASKPGRGQRLQDKNVGITVKDLSLTFRSRDKHGTVPVFRGLNLDFEPGAITAVIGPSGSGKTSLLHCIGGLQPFEGSIQVGGLTAREARHARAFGLVPQNPSLFEWKTTVQNIELPAQVFRERGPRAERRRNTQELIDLVGLTGFESAYPAQLSGGMKQRVSLARALSFHPAVMLLDEPFGALDSQTRQAMNLELLRIWASLSNTVVLITHDVTEAVLLADHIHVLSARPAQLHATVRVDLPRPRGLETLESDKLFHEVRRVGQLLREASSAPHRREVHQ